MRFDKMRFDKMLYVADMGSGETIYLQNQGSQTQITLSTSRAGQQQQQSSGFITGEWTAPPMLWRTAAGAIVQIQTAHGQTFVQLQSSDMNVLSQAPSLTDAEPIPLQHRDVDPAVTGMRPIQPLQPMAPMPPMTMGSMEMQMNPMQMRMGNMEMRMGEMRSSSQASSQASTKRFCTQCGTAVSPKDKFCAHCGHPLQPYPSS